MKKILAIFLVLIGIYLVLHISSLGNFAQEQGKANGIILLLFLPRYFLLSIGTKINKMH